MDKNLIFDLGYHNGDDTDFYLKKGFNVVAIEANPKLIEAGQRRFSKEIQSGQLKLLHNAVSDRSQKIDFFIHNSNSDWSSCFVSIAESDGSKSQKIEVQSITIETLFKEFSVPKYMKVDIEGCDLIVAQALVHAGDKPQYVSFETNKREYAELYAYLFVAGYKDFMLVNQMRNAQREVPAHSKEGLSISYQFGPFSSGLFGEDLPHERWQNYDRSLTNYVYYKELKKLDNQELGLGWLDLHARLS